MSLAATVRAMEQAGCTAKQIADVVVAHMAEADIRRDERRAKDAARKRKQRHAESRDVTRTECDIAGHSVTTVSAYTEDAPTHAEPEPNKTTSSPVQKDILTDIPKVPVAKPKSADAKCIAELGRVLDPEHAEAVVEHRNRLRKPMTARGAALLANSLAQAPDPNAAADEMIERGWQGWKADWGRNAQAPPRQAQNRCSLVDAINRMIPDEPQQQPGYPRLAFGR